MDADKAFLEALVNEHYDTYYKKITTSNSFVKMLKALTHKLLELGIPSKNQQGDVLEVGGGDGQHLSFVRPVYKSYIVSDLRPIDIKALSLLPSNVSFVRSDVAELPFRDAEFDRIISTCLLHHLDNPFGALKEIRRVARPDSQISIFLPTDPSPLYSVIRNMSTVRAARKRNYSPYNLIHALDHKNNYQSLYTLIKFVFAEDKIRFRFYPFFGFPLSLNAFAIFQITVRKP